MSVDLSKYSKATLAFWIKYSPFQPTKRQLDEIEETMRLKRLNDKAERLLKDLKQS